MKEPTTTATTPTSDPNAKLFDLGQELNRFETDVAMALNNEQEWLETHPEIISYFNRRAKQPVEYFIYKGIKVAGHGKAEEIDARINRPLSETLHGPNEGKIVGRSE